MTTLRKQLLKIWDKNEYCVNRKVFEDLIRHKFPKDFVSIMSFFDYAKCYKIKKGIKWENL